MAGVTRDYTLVLTVQVRVQEEENETNHDWLHEEIEAMFPSHQEKTIGRKIEANVSKRQLNRNYE